MTGRTAVDVLFAPLSTASPAGHLVWTGGTVVTLAAVIAAILVVLLALRGRRSPRSTVVEVLGLTVGLAALVIAVARPVWEEEEGRTEAGRLAILVDASASMAVMEEGVARSAGVQAVLSGLAGRPADLYHFGGDLLPGPPASFELPATDVEAALDALSDRVAGEKLAGVVLISDGIDRGLLRRAWQRGENPAPPQLPGPLTVVQVGRPADLKDLAVRDVDAGGYAYIHAPFTINAHLSGVGYAGEEVKADLLKDGSVVSSRKVRLDAEGLAEVAFQVTADRDGRFSYLVQVPDYAGDAVPANNSLPVVVRVVRDRMRVLQVAGSPSWDVKFLRRFLKGDPSVDLVSFFILRTKNDHIRRFNESELSLIQFPYQELFDEELLTFDLVIFQNFDYRPYFEDGADELLSNLASFVVDSGHAFAMIGGDRSFSLGAYGGTPLGEILPVEVSTESQEPDLATFLPLLTEAGQRHPVSRLVSDVDENTTWWQRLHTLDGTNIVGDARPGAAVLLSHPVLKTGSGQPMPVLAVREVGQGRTMSLTADTSWRWSLSEAAVGRGNQAYLRFWKGAMRWLVGDSTAERVTVDTPRENYALGDEVRMVVRSLDAGFAPMADLPVSVEVKVGADTETFTGKTDREGEAVISWVPTRRGAHRVTAKVSSSGHAVGEASSVFAVTNRDPELDEVVPDPAFLKWLAERSGGRFVAPGEAIDPMVDATAGRTVWTRRELPLWRTPILAVLALAGLGMAWVVRRRAGLR